MHPIPTNGTLRTIPTGTGWMVELRPGAVTRTFGAFFMMLWLLGWAAGEVVALAMLAIATASLFAPGAIRGLPVWPTGPTFWLGGAVLTVWLAFWTWAGIAAFRQLCESLWGVDRIGIDGADLVLDAHAGPLRRSRRWPRDAVRRILVHRGDGGLAVESTSGTTPLTRFGDSFTRLALRERLREALGLDEHALERGAGDDASGAPAGWEVEIASDGSTSLVPRREARGRQAAIAWMVVAVLVAAGWAIAARGPTTARPVFGVLALVAVAVGSWLSFGGTFFRVRGGALEHGIRFAGREWGARYEEPELSIERSFDSDGDATFRLLVADGERTHLLLCALNDSRPAIQLGRWIAARAGTRFEVTAEALERD